MSLPEEIDLTAPPAGAISLYSQGIVALERLGWPISCLRVYYVKSVGSTVFTRRTWTWDGQYWCVFERRYIKGHNTRLMEYRRGAWAEFPSLDDAKMVGAKRCETKVFPSEMYGTRNNYKLPVVHPAKGVWGSK